MMHGMSGIYNLRIDPNENMVDNSLLFVLVSPGVIIHHPKCMRLGGISTYGPLMKEVSNMVTGHA